MEVGLLYSGGRDSTLAALLLKRFCDVTPLCGTFGLPARRLDLDPAVAREAADRIVADGFPRNGIQQVQEHALERAAERRVDAVATPALTVESGPSAEVQKGDYETELRALIAAEHGAVPVAPSGSS
jgi:predicted subunit of tRNA(5-methylaminomethyl-2-thiouridylate) methyltransferase